MSPKDYSVYYLSIGVSGTSCSECSLDSVLSETKDSGHQNFYSLLASLRWAQSMFSSTFEIGIAVLSSGRALINFTRLRIRVTKAAFSKSVSWMSKDLNSTHQPMLESKVGGGLNLMEFQFVD